LADYVSTFINGVYPHQAALEADIPMQDTWYYMAAKLKRNASRRHSRKRENGLG
jgi:hypothetical protein